MVDIINGKTVYCPKCDKELVEFDGKINPKNPELAHVYANCDKCGRHYHWISCTDKGTKDINIIGFDIYFPSSNPDFAMMDSIRNHCVNCRHYVNVTGVKGVCTTYGVPNDPDDNDILLIRYDNTCNHFEDKIKPCPFCGGKAEYSVRPSDLALYGDAHMVMCSSCGIGTKMEDDKYTAIKKWNNRH